MVAVPVAAVSHFVGGGTRRVAYVHMLAALFLFNDPGMDEDGRGNCDYSVPMKWGCGWRDALHVGSLWRRPALPKRIDNWSLTSLHRRGYSATKGSGGLGAARCRRNAMEGPK